MKKQNNDRKDLRQIPELTRKYARSRMIPALVIMAVYLLFMGIIFGVPYLGVKAYRAGNMFAVWLCAIGFAGLSVTLIIFFVLQWKSGDKMIERIAARLYGSEGGVTLATPERIKKRHWMECLAVAVLGGGIGMTILLGFLDRIPLKYMQPISAIYIVPIMVFLMIGARSVKGLVPLLWPILYAIHAILVVAGAPIQFQFSGEFSRELQALNMCISIVIPFFGYGLLCGLIGHIYNRYALRKLKRLAGMGQDTDSSHPETE